MYTAVYLSKSLFPFHDVRSRVADSFEYSGNIGRPRTVILQRFLEVRGESIKLCVCNAHPLVNLFHALAGVFQLTPARFADHGHVP